MQRLLALLVAGGLATSTVQAQEWAKARLEKSPRHQEWVKIKHGDREVQAFVVYPEVKDKATAVVVIHEIFGLTDWVRGVADQLAEAGYIAITPDLLSGKGEKGGGTAEMKSGEVGKAIRDLPPDQITADLNATVDYVTKLPAANGKAAVGGFCWGGGQTFRFAGNNPAIKAAFVFYGGPGPATAEAASKIGCPVYGFYGGNDARVNATIPTASDAMKSAGKTYDPVTYEGAGHGFMRAGEDPKGNEPNRKAREEGWTRWKELLKKI
jgi:carboxymethylenebutenolidase